MNTRLVYVVGPSGAGKDSLLAWLRQQLVPDAPIAFARRTITRPVAPEGEQHESVEAHHFTHLRDAGAFGLYWEANRLHYGVRHAELPPKQNGAAVIVNGSRAHLPEAARLYPDMAVVHITASAQTLRQRLLSRGRESEEMVEARMQRALALHLPPELETVEIHNDDRELAQTGRQLVQALQQCGIPMPLHGRMGNHC